MENVFALSSLVNYLTFFAASFAVWLVVFSIYQVITPIKELTEIKNGNTAVAIHFLAVAVALALPLQAIGHSTFDIATLALWGFIGGLSQIVLHLVVRIFFKNLYTSLSSGNIAAALGISAVTLVVGLLNSTALTF
jgi:putative membrane protein